jgi:phosphatidylinositol 3-kinase
MSGLGPSTSHTQAAPSMASIAADAHLWSVVDPEVARDNPVEDKHRRLVRSHRSSPYDRELKPNAKIRDELGVSIIL